MFPLSGLLGLEGVVFPPEVLGLLGFSVGFVICSSSSEPLSASVMQPVKNARLSVRKQAKSQWGGVVEWVLNFILSP